MKTFQLTVTAMLVAALFSCKKEATQSAQQSGTVEEYLEGEKLTPERADASYEAGIYFYTTTDGQINSFSVHLPSEGMYTVTLWDPVDLTKITSAQINNPNTDIWNEGGIQPVSIKANKMYFLTVNSGFFYYLRGASKQLPFTKDNITIAGHIAGSSSGNTLGDFSATADLLNSGFVDFTFQPE